MKQKNQKLTLIKNKLLIIVLLGMAMSVLTACGNDDSDPENDGNGYKYILALSLPATESYPFHVLKDVQKGEANISESQEIPEIPNNVPVTTQPGVIYLNSAQKLTKYKVNDNGILEDIGSIQNLGISGGPVYEFLDENKLLISTGPRANNSGVFSYQIINTTDMTEINNGSITLPVKDATSTAIPSNYILKEGKIYVPYIHTNSKYAAYNQAPVAIFNASTMAYEKTIYTDKTASLGYSIVSAHGFAENGDLYITSCNSNYWGGNESLPSGIVRIKNGQTEFDDSYFFNLSEKFDGNHTGGMLYVGKNKAIVQVFRSDLIKAYSDYQNGFVIEYHMVDLSTKTTEKLNIPLTKYPRKTMALLKNGKAVIVGNTQSEGNNLYIVNPSDNKVEKGLAYTGTEFINALMSFE